MKKLIAVLSAAAMLLSFAACGHTDEAGSVAEETTSVSESGYTETEAEVNSEEYKTGESDETETAAETEAVTEAETGSDVNLEEKTTAAKAGTTAAVKDNINAGKMTTAEIVSLYNTSANKIKSTAKTITRNYQKMQNLPEYLELPSAIQSLGEWAIEKFVKGSDEPAVFDEKDEITEYFPVSGESYTSHLTADMVKSTKVEETDKTYRITIVLSDDKITSPAKGKGYAGVFNTVTASTFEDINVPGTTFEKVNVKGLNGKIVFTMDKETKQITHLTLFNTDYLDLGVKVAGAHLSVKMAFSNENDYTIRY